MAKAKRAPHIFMEFVHAIWEKRFPGCKPPAGTATLLAPLYHELGDEEASRRLSNYLASTPSQYVSLHKFAGIHSEFVEVYQKPARRIVNPSPPTSKEVAVEWDPMAGRFKPKAGSG